MELPTPLAVGTSIYFHVLHTNLAGTAFVCHCTRSGSKCLIGVVFGTCLVVTVAVMCGLVEGS